MAKVIEISGYKVKLRSYPGPIYVASVYIDEQWHAIRRSFLHRPSKIELIIAVNGTLDRVKSRS